jgi:hypothetical protein
MPTSQNGPEKKMSAGLATQLPGNMPAGVHGELCVGNCERCWPATPPW